MCLVQNYEYIFFDNILIFMKKRINLVISK